MTTDESEQSSELSAPKEPLLSESASPAGEQSPPSDPDLKPIGRCFNELNRVRQLTQQARTVNAQLQDALTALWACRDGVAGAALSGLLQRDSTASTCKLINSHIDFIERMIEI